MDETVKADLSLGFVSGADSLGHLCEQIHQPVLPLQLESQRASAAVLQRRQDLTDPALIEPVLQSVHQQPVKGNRCPATIQYSKSDRPQLMYSMCDDASPQEQEEWASKKHFVLRMNILTWGKHQPLPCSAPPQKNRRL